LHSSFTRFFAKRLSPAISIDEFRLRLKDSTTQVSLLKIIRSVAVGLSVIAIVVGIILPKLYPPRSAPPRGAATDATTPSSERVAQAAAVAQFPDLAKPGSRLNIEFVRRHNLYRKTKPGFFTDPDWPAKLASECSHDLAAGPTR